jgi:hypothetical protein
VVEEIGRSERIDDEVGFRGTIGLFGEFQVKRTLADIRALGRSGLAIGRAGINVAIVARSFDGEVPGRIKEFEIVEGTGIPAAGVDQGNLRVTDEHRDIVGPSGHGAGHLCGLGGDIGKGNCMRGVPTEVGGGTIEDVSDIRAELIFALGAEGEGEKQEE